MGSTFVTLGAKSGIEKSVEGKNAGKMFHKLDSNFVIDGSALVNLKTCQKGKHKSMWKSKRHEKVFFLFYGLNTI